jgi:hypothetical protein
MVQFSRVRSNKDLTASLYGKNNKLYHSNKTRAYEQKNDEIEKMLVDAIVEAPIEFELESKYFCIYPKCFGVNALVNNIHKWWMAVNGSRNGR